MTAARLQDLHENMTNREFVTTFVNHLLNLPTNLTTHQMSELLIDLIQNDYPILINKVITKFKNSAAALFAGITPETNSIWVALSRRDSETVLLQVDILKKSDSQFLHNTIVAMSDNDNRKLLHLATYSHEILQAMIDTFSKIHLYQLMDAVNDHWETPLHLACNNINLKSIALLINNGAIISTPNKSKQTPLQLILAFEQSDLEAVFDMLNYDYRRYFIEEIVRNSGLILNNDCMRLNYRIVMQRFSHHHPDAQILTDQPDQITRVSDKIKILDLINSDQHFENLINKIQQNALYIRQQQPYNIGYRIFTVVLNILVVCLLVGFVAPFSLLTKKTQSQINNINKLIDKTYAEANAGNITWEQEWSLLNAYWAQKDKLEITVQNYSTGIILPAIIFGVGLLASVLTLLALWYKDAKYKPEQLINFYEDIDQLLLLSRQHPEIISDHVKFQLNIFRNSTTAKNINDHCQQLANVESKVAEIQKTSFRQRFALYKLPRESHKPAEVQEEKPAIILG